MELMSLADTSGAERGRCREDEVTCQEKERAFDKVLASYTHLGATIVADEQTLCRLLQMLEFSGSDRDVGEYLCSFLTT
jgi:hypothetical protein